MATKLTEKKSRKKMSQKNENANKKTAKVFTIDEKAGNRQ